MANASTAVPVSCGVCALGPESCVWHGCGSCLCIETAKLICTCSIAVSHLGSVACRPWMINSISIWNLYYDSGRLSHAVHCSCIMSEAYEAILIRWWHTQLFICPEVLILLWRDNSISATGQWKRTKTWSLVPCLCQSFVCHMTPGLI